MVSKTVTLRELLEQKRDRLGLQLFSGSAGLETKISDQQVDILDINEDFWKHIKKGTILIVGRDHLGDFSEGYSSADNPIFKVIKRLEIPCIIFSNINFLPKHLIHFSEQNGIPFFMSQFDPFLLRSRIIGILREKIAGITAIQGVFVQVFGVGIIIQGESGLGKTECALELITRGHRFISDDLIEIYKARNITVFGRSPKISRNLLYVKGIGIINTKDLYGPGSVLNAAKVDMIVEFLEWDKGINLLGNELILKKIFDLDIPITRIPVRPNQMTTIIELIAKKFLYENSSKRRKKYFGE